MNRLDLFKAFYEYNHGYTSLSSLPQITSIEITNACNLNCRFCSREAVEKHRGIGYMNLEHYKYVLEDYGSQVVNPRIFLHGEPTLHPDLIEMIKLARQVGARTVGFTTNGTLVTPSFFKKMVDAGLNVVEFSFEGTDPETYEYFRRGASFDIVRKNILEACRVKTENGYKVDISINIIDNKLTHLKLGDFVNRWSKVGGLDRIDISPLIDWVETIDVGAYESYDSVSHEVLDVCPAPWFSVVVQYNGWVVPCCTWLYEPFGNIFQDDLNRIWNGPRFVNFRETMLKGRTNHPYCSKCKANPFSPNSPYLKKPTRLYPFTYSFLKVFILEPLKRRVTLSRY